MLYLFVQRQIVYLDVRYHGFCRVLMRQVKAPESYFKADIILSAIDQASLFSS